MLISVAPFRGSLSLASIFRGPRILLSIRLSDWAILSLQLTTARQLRYSAFSTSFAFWPLHLRRKARPRLTTVGNAINQVALVDSPVSHEYNNAKPMSKAAQEIVVTKIRCLEGCRKTIIAPNASAIRVPPDQRIQPRFTGPPPEILTTTPGTTR